MVRQPVMSAIQWPKDRQKESRNVSRQVGRKSEWNDVKGSMEKRFRERMIKTVNDIDRVRKESTEK